MCIDEDKRVECAVDAERYIDTVKQNILMLGDLLSECGYRLYKVTYDRLPVEINILNFEKYSGLVFNRKGLRQACIAHRLQEPPFYVKSGRCGFYEKGQACRGS